MIFALIKFQIHECLYCRLVLVPDAGHSMGEVGIAKELVDITNSYTK